MSAPRRVLTIGHSYCVRRNRELAEAMHTAGREGADGATWDVTVAAPLTFPGDLGPIVTKRDSTERATLRLLPVRIARRIHFMTYGRGLRELLAEPWDVVHCWEEPYVLSAAQIARACDPRPALVYASFQNIEKRYPPPFNAVEQYAMRRARGWIAFGETVQDVLKRRRGYAERPNTVIPFGVDVTRFAPDSAARSAMLAELGWDDGGPPVIGFVGRFVPEKGLPLLLAALDALQRDGTPWRALFVGGGALESQLRGFAARHGERVRVATAVPHDEVPRYLRAMDLLAAPSETTPGWREQFGRMIVEAFACGVPVVGSDSGEIPRVVGSAGLVVRERDLSGWTAALASLMTDPRARQEMGARGLARAASEFAGPIVARRHLDFFHRLLTTA
jgi:glycosyltransferase involved in cell wall biosynthesis